jgi:ADP-ribose pyrophosphatase
LADVYKAWEVIEQKSLLLAQPWLEVWKETVRLPDGRIIPDFYKIKAPDSCAIVAMTNDDNIVVVRQYKHGIGEDILGLPAGYFNAGESPLEAAKRELLEETGYVSDRWIDLGRYVRDANRGKSSVNVFLTRYATKNHQANSGDLETLTVELMPWAKLMQAVFQDQVKSLGLVTAILLARAYLDNPNFKD